jgi:hypothetical protein
MWKIYSVHCDSFTVYKQNKNSVALVREQTIPSDRSLSAKLVPNFVDRGCRMVSTTDPHGRILGFLCQSHYFFQVAPQLYSRGWVNPVPDPLLLRKYGSARNQTRDLCICSQELWPPQRQSLFFYIYIYITKMPDQKCSQIKLRQFNKISGAKQIYLKSMFWDEMPCSLVDMYKCFRGTQYIQLTMKMEAAGSFRMASAYQTIWHHIPEDHIFIDNTDLI